MKDRAKELAEKAKEIEELRKELSERAKELLDVSKSLYYWIMEYDELYEKHDKALDAYNAAFKKLVKAISEYNNAMERERTRKEIEMNLTDTEIAKLKGRYEEASDVLYVGYTNEEFPEKLKNKNKAWIAYRDAVKKRDAIKEKYAMSPMVHFGWGLIDEDEYEYE